MVARLRRSLPRSMRDEDWNAVRNCWDAMTYIIQLADDPTSNTARLWSEACTS